MAVRHNPRRGQCTINVNIKSGIYALSAPLVFNSSDSGSLQAKVVYRAAANNLFPVIISGAIPVSNFSCNSNSICTSAVAGLPAGIMPRVLR
jgi:hypothetical protein